MEGGVEEERMGGRMSKLHTEDFSVVTIELWINNASLSAVDSMIEHIAERYKLQIDIPVDDEPQECILKRSVKTKYPHSRDIYDHPSNLTKGT